MIRGLYYSYVIVLLAAVGFVGQSNWPFSTAAIDNLKSQGRLLERTTTITAAQVRTLNATQVEIVPAPGAGLAIAVERVQFMLDFNSNAYNNDAAGEDLVVTGGNFGIGSGVYVVRCDNAVCLDVDATQDEYGWTTAEDVTSTSGGHELVPNTNLELGILGGEIASPNNDSSGDSPIIVRVYYRLLKVDLS